LWTAICLISGSSLSPTQSAFLPFQPLFTESSSGDQLLAPPLFSEVLRAPHPLCCMFLFSSLFIIPLFFFFFFCRVGVSLSRWLSWFIPGVAVGILHAAYLFTCWSASPKQVWSQHLVAWEPSCFLSVM
jgi:hypothetical protein